MGFKDNTPWGIMLAIRAKEGQCSMGDFYSVQTEKSVDEAVEALGSVLKKHQFGVLWDLDINQKLVEKGIAEEPPFRILEVCSAPRAKMALSTNQMVGYLLPCKMVVYEDRQSGRTTIGFPQPDALLGMVKDEKLESFAKEVGGILTEAANEAARS